MPRRPLAVIDGKAAANYVPTSTWPSSPGGLDVATRLAATWSGSAGGAAGGRGAAPEGKPAPGPDLASHQAYCARWAPDLGSRRARPPAATTRRGRVVELAPLPTAGKHFVADVQAMRRRVEDTLPPDVAARNQVGPGRLRDVEFPFGCCGWHGGRTRLRVGSTVAIEALSAAASGGPTRRPRRTTAAVGGAPCSCRAGSTWSDDSVGDGATGAAGPGDGLPAGRWRRGGGVRRWASHARPPAAKLFTGRCCSGGPGASDRLRLSPEQRPAGWRRSVADPTAPCASVRPPPGSRRAIQRTLLLVLNELADAPDPTRAAGGRTTDALGDCRTCVPADEANRAGATVGTSRYVAELLGQARSTAHPRRRRAAAATRRTCSGPPPRGGPALRSARPGAAPPGAVRIAADAGLPTAEVGEALTDVVRPRRGGARRGRPYGAGPRGDADPVAVIAMGGSAARDRFRVDALFVHDPLPGPASRRPPWPERGVTELRHARAAGPDRRCRWTRRCAGGRSGPLVRTLASYRRTTGGVLAVGGAVARRWPATRRWVGVRRGSRPAALPGRRLTPAATIEIRRRRRMDAEQLPAAPTRPRTQLGRAAWSSGVDEAAAGGTARRCRGCVHPDAAGLAAARTPPVAADDTRGAEAGLAIATRARNAVVLVRGRPSAGFLGGQGPGRGAGGQLPAGPGPGPVPGRLPRATRRARAVVEHCSSTTDPGSDSGRRRGAGQPRRHHSRRAALAPRLDQAAAGAGGRRRPRPRADHGGHAEPDDRPARGDLAFSGDMLVSDELRTKPSATPATASTSPRCGRGGADHPRADWAVCHRERRSRPTGSAVRYPTFAAPYQLAQAEEASYDSCTTASNHTVKAWRRRGTLDTFDRSASGTSAAPVGGRAARWTIYRVRGADRPPGHARPERFTAPTPWSWPHRPAGSARRAAIRRAAKFVVVSLHRDGEGDALGVPAGVVTRCCGRRTSTCHRPPRPRGAPIRAGPTGGGRVRASNLLRSLALMPGGPRATPGQRIVRVTIAPDRGRYGCAGWATCRRSSRRPPMSSGWPRPSRTDQRRAAVDGRADHRRRLSRAR
jgi:glutamate-ammonia-ligase adenylyltransferase